MTIKWRTTSCALYLRAQRTHGEYYIVKSTSVDRRNTQVNASCAEYNGRNGEREREGARRITWGKKRKRGMPLFADRMTKKKDLYSFFYITTNFLLFMILA